MHTTEDISIGYDVLEVNKKLARNNQITLEKSELRLSISWAP